MLCLMAFNFYKYRKNPAESNSFEIAVLENLIF